MRIARSLHAVDCGMHYALHWGTTQGNGGFTSHGMIVTLSARKRFRNRARFDLARYRSGGHIPREEVTTSSSGARKDSGSAVRTNDDVIVYMLYAGQSGSQFSQLVESSAGCIGTALGQQKAPLTENKFTSGYPITIFFKCPFYTHSICFLSFWR